MNLAMVPDDFLGKSFEHFFLGNVAHIVVAFPDVDDDHCSAPLAKFIGNTFPNTMGTARHNDNFIFKIHKAYLMELNVKRLRQYLQSYNRGYQGEDKEQTPK